MSVGTRFGFSLVVALLILGHAFPATGQDAGVVKESATQMPPPAPAAEGSAGSTAQQSQVRRIVEDVLRQREAERSAATAATDDQECEDCFSLHDFLSEKLNVHLAGAGKLKIYGYGRGDLILTTGRLNNAVIPFFALSEDPTSLSAAGQPIRDHDTQFNGNVRLTRLGLDYSGTRARSLGDATLSAKIEIDFETLTNITSESRAVPRIRLAYGRMAWGELSILAGQDWDIISPLNPTINDDSLMWLAGNLGDRRPQLQVKWNHDLADGRRFLFASAISSGGAVDRKDLDGNGINDGEDSGVPAFQMRIGYVFPGLVNDRPAEIGAWGFISFEDVELPIGGHDDFVSRGVGFDWSLPLSSRITWRGEGWYGRDLSDWRGGVGQGVNTTTGEEIEAHGGWTELQLELQPWWKMAVGGTMDNPNDSDLIGNTTGRTLNWTWYVGNRFPLGGGLNIATNVEFWNTDYLTQRKGDAMRLKLWLIQRF